MNLKLRIELVPEPLWGKSLYHLLLPGVWDQIRVEHKCKHGAKCEICGSRAKPLYLHERWKYDDKKHVQKLLGFQLLCELCHSVKHIGWLGMKVIGEKVYTRELVEHFCKINRCLERDFDRHFHKAYEGWEKRSKYEWKQDFGKYKRYIKKGRAKKAG